MGWAGAGGPGQGGSRRLPRAGSRETTRKGQGPKNPFSLQNFTHLARPGRRRAPQPMHRLFIQDQGVGRGEGRVGHGVWRACGRKRARERGGVAGVGGGECVELDATGWALVQELAGYESARPPISGPVESRQILKLGGRGGERGRSRVRGARGKAPPPDARSSFLSRRGAQGALCLLAGRPDTGSPSISPPLDGIFRLTSGHEGEREVWGAGRRGRGGGGVVVWTKRKKKQSGIEGGAPPPFSGHSVPPTHTLTLSPLFLHSRPPQRHQVRQHRHTGRQLGACGWVADRPGDCDFDAWEKRGETRGEVRCGDGEKMGSSGLKNPQHSSPIQLTGDLLHPGLHL